MGNSTAHCADSTQTPAGDMPMPPLTAAPPPAPVSEQERLTNPGDYEELGKKVKEHLFPQTFEGFKVVLQKGLSRHFQTMHTLTLGSSTQPAQWQFGATYVGSKRVADNDFRPVLIGDMSTSGNFTAVCLHQFGSAWRVKLNGQAQQSKWVGYQGTLDYLGADFTASATLANPDPLSSSGVAVLQYLQTLAPRLALGTELLYQRGSGMQNALLSLGGYYRAKTWEATARLGLHAWHVSFLEKASKDVVLMAECDGNLVQGESCAAIGYKLELSGMTLRGRVDSHGTVGAVVERRLDPLPATLMLSGHLNHWTDESRFGIALVVG